MCCVAKNNPVYSMHLEDGVLMEQDYPLLNQLTLSMSAYPWYVADSWRISRCFHRLHPRKAVCHQQPWNLEPTPGHQSRICTASGHAAIWMTNIAHDSPPFSNDQTLPNCWFTQNCMYRMAAPQKQIMRMSKDLEWPLTIITFYNPYMGKSALFSENFVTLS